MNNCLETIENILTSLLQQSKWTEATKIIINTVKYAEGEII